MYIDDLTLTFTSGPNRKRKECECDSVKVKKNQTAMERRAGEADLLLLGTHSPENHTF